MTGFYFVGDYLGARDALGVQQALAKHGDARVVFADAVRKLKPPRLEAAPRALVVTERAVYNMTPAPRYKVNRRIPLEHLTAVSMSTYADDYVVLHATTPKGGAHDYVCVCRHKAELLTVLAAELRPGLETRFDARQSFAEHLIATKALRRTATAWNLIVAQCSANPRQDALARLNANKSQMQKDFQAHCRHVRGQEEGFRKALAGQQQAGKGQQQQQQQQQEQPGQPQQQQPGQGQGGQQQGGEQQQQGGPAAAAADPAFDQKRMEEHVRQLNAQIKSMATEQHQLTEFCDRMHELGNSFKPLGRQLAASMGLPPFECFAKEEQKQQQPQEGQQEAAAGAADDAAAPAPAEGAAGGGQEGAATTTA